MLPATPVRRVQEVPHGRARGGSCARTLERIGDLLVVQLAMSCNDPQVLRDDAPDSARSLEGLPFASDTHHRRRPGLSDGRAGGGEQHDGGQQPACRPATEVSSNRSHASHPISISGGGGPLQKSLFAPAYESELNRAVREVDVYLDGKETLRWWHRNLGGANGS